MQTANLFFIEHREHCSHDDGAMSMQRPTDRRDGSITWSSYNWTAANAEMPRRFYHVRISPPLMIRGCLKLCQTNSNGDGS